jgi:phytol kinase
MGTGPIFVLCWLLFTDSIWARWLAALVPFAITIQFALVGSGVIRDKAAVQAMSRTGDRREILKGPLFYGIVFIVLTLGYWRYSPIGIVALMLMCGGDGLADVLGRRFNKSHLPWNSTKTWAGSAGMLVGGWIFASVTLAVYIHFGYFPGLLNSYLLGLTIVAVGGTIVESLPFHDIDNITVTLTAIALGHLIFTR